MAKIAWTAVTFGTQQISNERTWDLENGRKRSVVLVCDSDG